MNGKRCEFRDPDIDGVAPPCPAASEDDSIYCTEHRAYGWKSHNRKVTEEAVTE